MPARRAPNAEEEGVMAHVAQLYRYPVKSMQGERVDRLEFTSGSAVGDRQLALADAETGVYLSAKRHGQVLEAFARTEADGSVVISLPHGVEIGASDPAANGVLSEWLGRHVELRVAGSDQAPSYESLADSTDDGSATVTFADRRPISLTSPTSTCSRRRACGRPQRCAARVIGMPAGSDPRRSWRWKGRGIWKMTGSARP